MCSVTLKFFVRKQIIAAIVFSCILKSVQCSSKLTFNKKHIGQRLVGFNIVTLTDESIGTCVNKCFQLTHCLSTNFDTVSKQCDLNNITADQMPTAIVKSGMSILSDLSAWPKAMVASCGDKPCNGRDICLPAGNTFLCHSSDCPKAPLFGKTTSTGSVKIGGKMVYKCKQPSQRIIGQNNIQCGWMNTWSSNSDIKCSADCGDPTPAYGTSSSNFFTYPTTLTISCDPGYVLSGPASITCRQEGTWSDTPTCEPKDCGDPTPAHGTSDRTMFTYQTTLTISCDHGYVLSGPASITCRQEGTWSDTPSCDPIDCGDPTPAHGTSDSTMFTYRTTLTISCDRGYVLSGPASITCRQEGTWSDTPTCEPKDCGDPTPAYGTSSSNMFTYPTTLTISCDPGYVLSGPASITCRQEGTWSETPTCEPKDCGDPTPAHGTSDSTMFTYQTTLTILCDPGYVLSGPASITCRQEGTWSDTSTCEPKECGNPTPAHGTSDSTMFTYQTTLTILCDPGYVVSGPASMTCGADGIWSSTSTCELKDCGDPTPVYGTTSSTTYTYQTTLTISCDAGYVLSGPASITCKADGIWSSTSTCELKEQCYDTQTYNMYVGHYGKTQSGKTCQRWDSQTPHSHIHNDATLFPDVTLADAANYCRDPDNSGHLWCYTTDPDLRIEGCGMSRCECWKTDTAQGYAGSWNVTKMGIQCQRWDSNTPHHNSFYTNPSMYPESTLTDADNYCRDPGSDGYLWCYTIDPNTKWQICDIEKCTFS